MTTRGYRVRVRVRARVRVRVPEALAYERIILSIVGGISYHVLLRKEELAIIYSYPVSYHILLLLLQRRHLPREDMGLRSGSGSGSGLGLGSGSGLRFCPTPSPNPNPKQARQHAAAHARCVELAVCCLAQLMIHSSSAQLELVRVRVGP